MNVKGLCLVLFALLSMFSTAMPEITQPFYKDKPFEQDYAEKIPLSEEISRVELLTVAADRNGRIQILSSKGLMQIYQGELVRENQYQPLRDMQIRGLDIYKNQFVYLTDKMVLSNAWAGNFLVPHEMPGAHLFKMGDNFDFLVGGNGTIVYFHKDRQAAQWKTNRQQIKQIFYDRVGRRYFLVYDAHIDCYSPGKEVVTIFKGQHLNCLEMLDGNAVIILGTRDGYIKLDANSFQPQGPIQKELPWPDIRVIKQIAGKIWFGTPRGAFALRQSGKIDYYAGGRWLVDDEVVDIAPDPGGNVLLLTRKGLNIIHFEKMTLLEKANHFEKLTRMRHVRYGFNSPLRLSRPGDLSTGTLEDKDNDGLWTAMYLGGELFRYAVTKSADALENCHEAFEAMERLEYINPLNGFPARSFVRTGYAVHHKDRWHPTQDGYWQWKATTSSDEIVGHFFAYSIFAEVIPEESWRERAIILMDKIMDHIVRNDFYLIDIDGKPTDWGKWNPDYVNKFPKGVGDRRLNSVEIISFLQTAYHFTKKDVYRDKAYELLDKYGYLNNIMTPMSEIGFVKGIYLSDTWNHSDDELAFLSYWNLYKYAFTDDLREKYKQTIRSHWEVERPEKDPLWDFIYAMTQVEQFDLKESIWTLQEFPLDTINWSVKNSHRRDLKFLKPNFRRQETLVVLPPDERRMGKHNFNVFELDSDDGGYREYSGDIYLLPYWMGRYLGVIR